MHWQQEGRVGGAVSRGQQWRPGYFGTDTCFSHRATWAADRHTLSDISPCSEGLCSQCPRHQSHARRCQRTVAAGAPPEGQLSPTHPPCGLAPLLGAGGRDLPLERRARPGCGGASRRCPWGHGRPERHQKAAGQLGASGLAANVVAFLCSTCRRQRRLAVSIAFLKPPHPPARVALPKHVGGHRCSPGGVPARPPRLVAERPGRRFQSLQDEADPGLRNGLMAQARGARIGMCGNRATPGCGPAPLLQPLQRRER